MTGRKLVTQVLKCRGATGHRSLKQRLEDRAKVAERIQCRTTKGCRVPFCNGVRIGVVKNLNCLLSPHYRHDDIACQHQVDNRSQGRGPAFDRTKRRRHPVEVANARCHLAVSWWPGLSCCTQMRARTSLTFAEEKYRRGAFAAPIACKDYRPGFRNCPGLAPDCDCIAGVGFIFCDATLIAARPARKEGHHVQVDAAYPGTGPADVVNPIIGRCARRYPGSYPTGRHDLSRSK